MTQRQAIDAARRRALKTNREYFVIWSVEDHDPRGEHYHYASADDLEWFYAGCNPVLMVEPDGTVNP